ncbi:ankyrin repeat domain-containing protein, partial [Candidatus Poribacteria bacterium]|nr:ankyrin repeat domain-containing protein [Candidatus Poribacteria bacterium]
EKGSAVIAHNRSGETALMYAAWRGLPDIVQLLLEQRADISLKNRQGNTALTLAESKGNLNIVQMLRAATE